MTTDGGQKACLIVHVFNEFPGKYSFKCPSEIKLLDIGLHYLHVEMARLRDQLGVEVDPNGLLGDFSDGLVHPVRPPGAACGSKI